MQFDALYEQYKVQVYNLALQYVQNTRDAEEITQDVFVAVYQKLSVFRQEASPKTWIYRITVNKSLDYLRMRKTKSQSFLRSFLQIDAPNSYFEHATFDHPGVQMEQRESTMAIFKAINQLSEQQKTVVLLLRIEQLPQKEVAAIMQINEGAVESLYQRAKKNLQKRISDTKD